MKKLIKAIGPALLSCALAIGCYLVCASIFHAPPIATKVVTIVIIGTTALVLFVTGVMSLLRSKPE